MADASSGTSAAGWASAATAGAGIASGIADSIMGPSDTPSQINLTPEQQIAYIAQAENNLKLYNNNIAKTTKLQSIYDNAFKTINGIIQGTRSLKLDCSFKIV